MNHVSYSVNFIVRNASIFEDLNMDTVTQYLNTRKGPMSSTGMSQVKHNFTFIQRSLVIFVLYFKCLKTITLRWFKGGGDFNSWNLSKTVSELNKLFYCQTEFQKQFRKDLGLKINAYNTRNIQHNEQNPVAIHSSAQVPVQTVWISVLLYHGTILDALRTEADPVSGTAVSLRNTRGTTSGNTIFLYAIRDPL